MVWPLDESQGSSPLQSDNSWLMCEVALRCIDPTCEPTAFACRCYKRQHIDLK